MSNPFPRGTTGDDEADTDQEPRATLTAREAADNYWSTVSTFALTNYRYESLDEMTKDAHLVVRARLVGVSIETIQSFEENPLHESVPVAFGLFEVVEVLKGTPQSKTPGTILVARLGVDGADKSSLPQEQVILFLKNYAQMRRDEGVEDSKDADDQYHYAQPNGYQCLFRDLDGRISLVPGPEGWQNALGPFPSELEGRQVGDVAAEIAHLVELEHAVQ